MYDESRFFKIAWALADAAGKIPAFRREPNPRGVTMRKYLLLGSIMGLAVPCVVGAGPEVLPAPAALPGPVYNAQPIDFWLEALGERDYRVRENAATALGKIGPPAAGAVPALIESLSDRYVSVRLAAVHALSRMGPAKTAVPALAKLLEAGPATFDVDLAVAATQTLARLGPDAQAAVEPLRRLLAVRDADFKRRWPDRPGATLQLREAAAAALADVHDPSGTGRVIALLMSQKSFNLADPRRDLDVPDLERRLQLLGRAMKDPAVDTRVLALEMIGQLVSRAKQHRDIEALKEILKELYKITEKKPEDVKEADKGKDGDKKKEADKVKNGDKKKDGEKDVEKEKDGDKERDAKRVYDAAMGARLAIEERARDSTAELIGKLTDPRARKEAIDALAGWLPDGREVLLRAVAEVQSRDTADLILQALEPKKKNPPPGK